MNLRLSIQVSIAAVLLPLDKRKLFHIVIFLKEEIPFLDLYLYTQTRAEQLGTCSTCKRE
ncbi:MAG: hypothetical protein CEE38_22585 [Planctomycetes bacterium B3_Pla]|nr:MAG: hypothetical protein CEE38_22585 [Planctomycetes bacterium B3_Pla]